ncbi:OmpA family protein [Planctobacterium marinum]|uniref:Porin n=1 Tax=Planctobacterium marinum TaxID=1631968 RepID=A0AA48KVX2_9ALTE|nr:porin [Planctobacterium marinum]
MERLFKHSLVLTSLLSLGLYTTQTSAVESCFDTDTKCSPQLGWYIGGEFGKSVSDFDKERFLSTADDAGLQINSFSFDDSDLSHGLLFGYQVNPNFALEVGYRDLGDYTSTFTGFTTDTAEFLQDASAQVPESGEGLTAGIVLSLPFDIMKLSAKVGFWEWDNDIDSTPFSSVVSDSGTDMYYGAEVSYQVTEKMQAYLAAVRYEFDRDKSDNVTLGLRYFFDTSAPKKATKPALRPAPQPAPAPVKMADSGPVDSDKDGVYDDKDACPGTPQSHAVDSKGCTLYEAVDYQHQLIVYYANNSDVITSDYNSKIKELVDFARDNGIKYLQIIGHTSAPGTDEYNMGLSKRRAESLKKILVDKYGFAANQIETVGKGETELAVQGNGESAHSKNRRIVVNLSATGKNPKMR